MAYCRQIDLVVEMRFNYMIINEKLNFLGRAEGGGICWTEVKILLYFKVL